MKLEMTLPMIFLGCFSALNGVLSQFYYGGPPHGYRGAVEQQFHPNQQFQKQRTSYGYPTNQYDRPQRSLYGVGGGWNGIGLSPVGLGYISKEKLIELLQAWKEANRPAPTPMPEPEMMAEAEPEMEVEPEPEPEAEAEPAPAPPAPAPAPAPEGRPPPAGVPLTVSLPAFVPIQLSAMYTAPAPAAPPAAPEPEMMVEAEMEMEAEPEPESNAASEQAYKFYGPHFASRSSSARQFQAAVRTAPRKATKMTRTMSGSTRSLKKPRSLQLTFDVSSPRIYSAPPPPPFLRSMPPHLKLAPSSLFLRNFN